VLYLFGIAAVLLALAIVLLVWKRSRTADELVAGGVTPVVSAAVSSSAPGVPAATAAPAALPSPAPTLGPLPTAGPAGAADAVVGAPRIVSAGPAPAPTRVPRATPIPSSDSRFAAPPTSSADASSHDRDRDRDRDRESSGPVPDNVYRTRRFGKFGVSPDQARMYVDGHYVGIADDWDDRGGGRKFEFHREGTHHVRFELPGYRDLKVDVIVTSGADDDTTDIGDELKRESRQPYTKLSSPNEQTVGPVVFEIDPPDAVISENGKALGAAGSFSSSSPLKLSGPMVHDLVISAPGRKSKPIRILVAPNADNPQAKVKAELKKE
jgi:hypothetical protein